MEQLHEPAQYKRRVEAARVKADYTEYALSGFRRSHYAGVFQKLEGKTPPAFLAEIKLDGFERSLSVKITIQRDNANGTSVRGHLHGPPLKLERRTFNFEPISGSPKHLKGIVNLRNARLIINLLPAPALRDRNVYLCFVEVDRTNG